MIINPSDLDIILAKRSHPELNKKYDLDYIIRENYKDSDLYCSFSNVKKLGINPQSKWKTFAPVMGVWSYPIKYLETQIVDKPKLYDRIVYNKERIDINDYVFGSRLKYLFIIKDNHIGRHLFEDKYTDKNLQEDIEAIKEYYKEETSKLSKREQRVIENEIGYVLSDRENNIKGLTDVIEVFASSSSAVTRILVDALNITCISWINNQLHSDIKEETCWLSNKAFTIVDIIEDYNKKKFRKYFLNDRDDPSYQRQDWLNFIKAVNEEPEYIDGLDKVVSKQDLIDVFNNWVKYC